MLSSVLHSDRAVLVNIEIMRAFVRLRQLLATHADLQWVEGAFVLFDPQTGRTVRHNAERARTRFLPASTFKIPNTLIALETGVASGPDFPLTRDSAVAPARSGGRRCGPRITRSGRR
ncbi:MAG: penicillin-binding transpeptidase domain-containing protein [Burkholderiales bacterium]